MTVIIIAKVASVRLLIVFISSFPSALSLVAWRIVLPVVNPILLTFVNHVFGAGNCMIAPQNGHCLEQKRQRGESPNVPDLLCAKMAMGMLF
jgi:hypothetical protein